MILELLRSLSAGINKAIEIIKNMNSCNNCRWVMSEILVLADRTCEKHWKIHPIYGKMYLSCEYVRKAKEFHNTFDHCSEWEQGGLKGWFQRLKKKFYD